MRFDKPMIVIGGGIGGLAAALALSQRGFPVKVLEQAEEIGEIGAGIQLGPNAFNAFDALGIGDTVRGRAVFTDELVMFDAIDASVVGKVPTGEAFRKRFGNPYAVIHRVDIHLSLLEAVRARQGVEFVTATRAVRVDQNSGGVIVFDQNGQEHHGVALIAADGSKSVVRDQYVADALRVTGHVVYRAVVDKQDFPEELRLNAAALWAGPNCHLVHYPLRGGEQYNVVVTFHSREAEEAGIRDGSKGEVESYFQDVCPKARQLIDLPKSWRRWATADRQPIETWSFGRVTLLGDAAHPTTQYMAQGACMALEDAVTLGEALRVCDDHIERAFDLYQRSRSTRTGRIVLSSREMGRLYHANGIDRHIRNSLWAGRQPERFFDAVEWLYGWTVRTCLIEQA